MAKKKKKKALYTCMKKQSREHAGSRPNVQDTHIYLHTHIHTHTGGGWEALVRQGKSHYLALVPESELRVK